MQQLRGFVTKAIGNRCDVWVDTERRPYPCRVKGALRIGGKRSTNPIVVGDEVMFTPPIETSQDEIFIDEILPRRNYIIRKATNLSKESHILAANIDVALLVVTIKRPQTSLLFIDRFLTTAEAYGVTTHIVFNKVDDLSDQEAEILFEYDQLYSSIGYQCFLVSALKKKGLEKVLEQIQGQRTLLCGHSGVGKSTLINALIPEARQRTAEISSQHETGVHTTTYSEMLETPNGGWIIDTPGIKGFGTLEMNEANTSHYFREFWALHSRCKFSNCTHLHEPGCAIIAALEKGEIAPSRYRSYLSILDDRHEGTYREDL